MKEPDLVSECINEMVNSCKIPVSAKTRIGFDDVEEFDYLNNFVLKIKEAGCKTFIIHARKAILKGLTPEQNLNIPNRWYTHDNNSYPLKNHKYYKFYKKHFTKLIKEKNIEVIYITGDIKIKNFQIYMDNVCFDEKKINEISSMFELKNC